MKFKYTEEKKKDGGSGQFLKIESGEHVIGLLRGEIVTFYKIFEDGKYRVVSKGTKKATERHKVNIIVNGDDGKPVAKIFEFGRGVMNAFYHLQEDYGDLERIFVKIRREGVKKDTKWFVSVPKDQPSERVLESLNAIPLNILDTEAEEQEDGLPTMPESKVKDRIEEVRSKASKGAERFPGDDFSNADEEIPF